LLNKALLDSNQVEKRLMVGEAGLGPATSSL
jgi:hypothetical protein